MKKCVKPVQLPGEAEPGRIVAVLEGTDDDVDLVSLGDDHGGSQLQSGVRPVGDDLLIVL
jgi:hypothetical protein